jgi:hypothetical protein
MLAFVLFIKVWVGIISVPIVETPDIPAGWTAVQLKWLLDCAVQCYTKAKSLPEQMVWLDGEKVTTGTGLR